MTNTKSGVQIKLNNSYQQTVSAEIMSMNGKMVRHLSGNEASFWNCKDAFGNTVKNGTYLIRVCVAGKTYQDKVLISR